MKRFNSLFLVAVVLIAACSSKKTYTHVLSGKITVADSVDASKDYSGIGYLVIKRDSTQKADTVFFAQTDKEGKFSGKAVTTFRGLYPVYITRNKKILASSSIILTESDSVQIRAELPAYNQTEKLFSREYEAKGVFDRLNKNFSRIAQFVNAGKVTPDTLPVILKNWSDIYWSVHKKYPGTIAANESVIESLRLLTGIDDEYLEDNWRLFLLDFLHNGNFDAVFHVGACSDTMEQDVNYMMIRNYETTKIIADYCLKNNVRLIYSSSAANYGTNNLNPSNLYGWSKYVSEQYVLKSNGIALRYFNVYGPGEENKGKMSSLSYQSFLKHKNNEEI